MAVFLPLYFLLFVGLAYGQNQTIYQALKSLSNDSTLSFNVSENGNSSSVSKFFKLVDEDSSLKSLLDSSNATGLFVFAPIDYAFMSSNKTNNSAAVSMKNDKNDTASTQGVASSHIYNRTGQVYHPVPGSVNTTGLFLLQSAALNETRSFAVLNATNASSLLSANGLYEPIMLLGLSSPKAKEDSNSSSSRPHIVNCTNGVIYFTKDLILPQYKLDSKTIDMISKSNSSESSNVTSPIRSASKFLSAMKNSSHLATNGTAASPYAIFAVSDSALQSTNLTLNDTVLSNQIFNLSGEKTNSLPITSPLLFNISSNAGNTTLTALNGAPLKISARSANSSLDASRLSLNESVSILHPDLLYQNATVFIVDKLFQMQQQHANATTTAPLIKPKLPQNVVA